MMTSQKQSVAVPVVSRTDCEAQDKMTLQCTALLVSSINAENADYAPRAGNCTLFDVFMALRP